LYFQHPEILMFTWIFIAFYFTTMEPAIIRKWVIPNIEKKYASKTTYTHEQRLKPRVGNLYPTIVISSYIAYKCLGLSRYIRIAPGSSSEWLVDIGYDQKTAPFLEKFICVYSFLLGIITIVVILTLCVVLICITLLYFIIKLHNFLSLMLG
jgi:hypothetical protein